MQIVSATFCEANNEVLVGGDQDLKGITMCEIIHLNFVCKQYLFILRKKCQNIIQRV